jgi:hypothetical protein
MHRAPSWWRTHDFVMHVAVEICATLTGLTRRLNQTSVTSRNLQVVRRYADDRRTGSASRRVLPTIAGSLLTTSRHV